MDDFLPGIVVGLLLGVLASILALDSYVKAENIMAAAIACEPFGGLKAVDSGSTVSVKCNNGIKLRFDSVVKD